MNATTMTEEERIKSGVPVRVMAALSMPRLCFTDVMTLVSALPSMNIEVRKSSGAYWEQCMSRLLYEAVERDFDYVLTIDYDSVFQPMDVYMMIRLMAETPDATAIFPLQYRRGVKQLLLANLENSDMVDRSAALMPARVGHFGCTIIRLSHLKEIPHPWLQSFPNKEGKWGPGQKDADIYFWDKLHAHGKKVYCATRIVIGHIQEMITWPGQDLQPVHEYVADYFADGDLPKEVQEAAIGRMPEELQLKAHENLAKQVAKREALKNEHIKEKINA